MKSYTYFFPTICLFVVLGCSNEKPKEAQNFDPNKLSTISLTSKKIPDFSSDYLVSVYEKQELIKISQEDKELRKQYCDESYLKEQKLFISMGIAKLKNPETGEAIPRSMAERVAIIDAKRWASYGELWIFNNYEPPFGKLSKNFKRTVTVINQSVVGDSLFIFLATSLPQ